MNKATPGCLPTGSATSTAITAIKAGVHVAVVCRGLVRKNGSGYPAGAGASGGRGGSRWEASALFSQELTTNLGTEGGLDLG